MATAQTLVRRVSGKAHLKAMKEGTDAAVLSDIERSSGGAAALWNDANVTGITIGGGSANTGVDIGKSGTTTTVKGDLHVEGTTTTVDSETVMIAENHLFLNKDYVTVAGQTGGLAINYLPTVTNDETDTGGFATTTTAVTAGSATFAAGDIIQVSGAAEVVNDGVYEVATHSGTTLTIEGSPTHDFCKSAWTADTDDVTAVITKITVALIQCKIDGVWQTGKGATESALTSSFADVASATLGWDDVLANDAGTGANSPAIATGQKIVGDAELTLEGTTSVDIDASNGAMTLDATAGVSIDAGAASNFTTSSGALTLNGNGGININGNAAEIDITTSSALDLNGATVTIDGSNGVSIDGTGAASNFTSAGQNLTISTTSSGTLLLDGVALVDINAGANLDIDVTGTFDMLATSTFSIDGTGASNVTATTGGLTLSTITSGTLAITGVAAVTIDGTGVSIDGTAASNLSTTAANLTLSTITSGTLFVTSVGLVDIDGSAGFNIDGSGAACNVTAAAQALTVATTTSGTLTVSSAGTLDIDGVAVTLDASSGFSIDGAGASCNVSATSQALTISTITSGTLSIASAATLDIDGVAVSIDASGGFSIDGAGGACNVSATGQNLTISTITSGTLAITSIGTLDLDGTVVTIDCTAGNDITLTAASNASSDVIFVAHGGTTNYNDATHTTLSGFTATSIIGALNELKASGGGTLENTFTDSGAGLAANVCVFLAGTPGLVTIADASGIATATFIGVTEAAISADADGQIVTEGIIDIEGDDATYTAGDEVYLSEVAGQITKTTPTTASSVVLSVGFVHTTVTVSGNDNPVKTILTRGMKMVNAA